MELELYYSIPEDYIYLGDVYKNIDLYTNNYENDPIDKYKFKLINNSAPYIYIYKISDDNDKETLVKILNPKTFYETNSYKFLMNYNLYHKYIKLYLPYKNSFSHLRIYVDELYLLRTTMKPNILLQNLNFVINQEFNIKPCYFNIKEEIYSDFNIINKDIINSYLKLQLHDYQIANINWMKNIENNININSCLFYVSYDHYHNISNKFYINKYNNICYTKEQIKFKYDASIKINGGILSDSVGKGKTATVIGLIVADKYNFKKKEPLIIKLKKKEPLINEVNINSVNINSVNINNTLIVCPRKLSEQWRLEFHKFCNNIKIITLNTIHDYNKYTLNDYTNSDVVIVSTSYLINTNYLDAIKLDNSKNIMEMKWKRLVIDESHEIIKFRKLKSDQLISKSLFDLDVKYKWCLTATPFPDNDKSYIEILKFLSPDFINLHSLNENIYVFIYNEFINSFLRKNDTSMIKLPEYIYKNIFIDFSEIEKIIYKNVLASNTYNVEEKLKQLCTNIFIDKEEASIINNENASPEEIANKMKEHYINIKNELNETYEMYKSKEDKLNIELKDAKEQKEILSIKGKLSRIYENYKKLSIEKDKINKSISSFSNYGNEISFPTINDKSLCSMCNSSIKTYIIQPNGYYFCELCIDFICNNDIYLCPMTGEEIKKSSLKKFTISSSSSSSSSNLTSESMSESISKSISESNSNILWGSKLEYIFKEIKIILSKNIDNKILIFSQWDKMLNIISNMLKYYYINFTNCKGNVYQINKAIREFKTNPTCSILLLSAETSNSGINLPEVSHIILIDTVSHIHSNVIEKQAIGRAVRIGQTKNVFVNRLIMNDSIEFDYYLNSN